MKLMKPLLVLGAAALMLTSVATAGAATRQQDRQKLHDGTPGTCVPSDPSTPLTPAEADGLTFMREEEKLARDVYVLLGDRYDVRIFDNIARSESRHMAAVKRLMDIYSVPDPVGTDVPGSFKDPVLSELYTSLTAQGERSLAEALRVGVVIEKRDISDLKDRIAATDRPDLKAVYGNLLRASNNHLRAFTRQLARLRSL